MKREALICFKISVAGMNRNATTRMCQVVVLRCDALGVKKLLVVMVHWTQVGLSFFYFINKHSIRILVE